MKIYVSGSYNEQKRLRLEAHKLHGLGHAITSTWLNEVLPPTHLSHDEWFTALAVKDLAEVATADCIIMDLDGVSTSGGRWVEWGFALGRFNMLKLLVGSSHYGVFNHLADHKFHNWEEVIEFFKTRSGSSQQANPEQCQRATVRSPSEQIAAGSPPYTRWVAKYDSGSQSSSAGLVDAPQTKRSLDRGPGPESISIYDTRGF